MSLEREIAIQEALASHPAAAWWKRLPIIRHIRATMVTVSINRHYNLFRSLGYFPVNSDLDFAIRDAIWRGEK